MSIAMFAALANAIMTTIPVPGGLGFVETALITVLLLVGLNHTDAVYSHYFGPRDIVAQHRRVRWFSISCDDAETHIQRSVNRG